MSALLLSRSVFRALATRAFVLWVSLRVLITAVFLLVPPTEASARQPAHAASPSATMIVVLCALVALIDMRRRREVMLWANLGISSAQLAIFFALVATSGEIALSVIRR